MKRGFLAGSFDPPTLGHLDLIKRGAALCDELIVGIGNHADKKSALSKQKRMELLTKITSPLQNVSIISFDELAFETAVKEGAHFLIRALRSVNDFQAESEMAAANQRLGRIETLFLLADPKLADISSSRVRELARHRKRLHGFVPEAIEEEVYQLLIQNR